MTGLQARPAQAVRRGVRRRQGRRRPRRGPRHRPRDRRGAAHRRPGRDRHRRRQLLPRRRAPAARHGPCPRRLHGHARHRDELPGPPGLPGEGGHRDAGADRHHHGPGRRALHPAPRDPAPREGPRRHLRRRRRPAVLLHRHRRRPARPGDQVRGRADGQERRRRGVRRRPAHPPRRREVRRAHLRRGAPAGPQGGRRDRVRAVHGERTADGRLRHAARGQHPPRRAG